MPPPAVPDRRLAKTPDWTTPMNLPDPFIENRVGHRYRSFGSRTGSEDLSMLDYSHSITSAGSRNVSATNNTNQKALVLMASISHERSDTVSNVTGVRKDGTSGTFAPGDDGRCSKVTSDAHTVVTKPSAAAAARIAPRGQRHGGQTSFKGPTKLTNRKKSSDVSIKSRLPEDAGETQDVLHDKAHTKPAGSIQGKSAGKGSDFEAKQQETSTAPRVHAKRENARMVNDTRATASEGKRKRVLTVPENSVPAKVREVQSSPTRQAPKKMSQGGRTAITIRDLTIEDGVVKAPLQVLRNVQ